MLIGCQKEEEELNSIQQTSAASCPEFTYIQLEDSSYVTYPEPTNTCAKIHFIGWDDDMGYAEISLDNGMYHYYNEELGQQDESWNKYISEGTVLTWNHNPVHSLSGDSITMTVIITISYEDIIAIPLDSYQGSIILEW